MLNYPYGGAAKELQWVPRDPSNGTPCAQLIFRQLLTERDFPKWSTPSKDFPQEGDLGAYMGVRGKSSLMCCLGPFITKRR